ncbi:alpha/beta hydrolase [Helicobacter suis]|uniref:alpha/beta hydrolase n=1 Tax=Helicobacter suis TaxID=104628 RepID=UPI0019675C57|nr:alpha/beta hydrolase [Helicobacter suis]
MRLFLVFFTMLCLTLQAQEFKTTGTEKSLIKGNNFYVSTRVKVQEVSFKNQYGLEVVGKLFTPKDMQEGKKYPALVVGHPMGAVKEQSASLYATKMAEKGFVALAFDLSFWGESAGVPRNGVLPDMFVEDFSAAVDYLQTRSFVNPEEIGALGICASGGFALAAAKIDLRIKAIATVSMYNMGEAARYGIRHSTTKQQRQALLKKASKERTEEFLSGKTKEYVLGTPLKITKNSTPAEKEFYDFYRTQRGEYTPKGAPRDKTTMPTLTGIVKFLNFYPFENLDWISPRPLLFITGDHAHSKEFSELAYKKAKEPKELYYVKGAGHVDLYDRADKIPFDKIAFFFKHNLEKGK